MKDSQRKAMFAKMRKLEKYLEHARTQQVPISAKENQLIRMKGKLGLTHELSNDDKKTLEQLKMKPSERSMWYR